MENSSKKLGTDELKNVAGGKITEAQAYKAALKHAGISEKKASLKKSELDFDDGIQKYEIKFTSGLTEYEYDINAADGSVLGFERDGIWD